MYIRIKYTHPHFYAHFSLIFLIMSKITYSILYFKYWDICQILYVSIHIYIYIYIYISSVCMHICLRVYVFIYIHISTHICIYVCVCVKRHVYIYIYIYIYTLLTHTHTHTHIYINIYIYIYLYITHMHIHTFNSIVYRLKKVIFAIISIFVCEWWVMTRKVNTHRPTYIFIQRWIYDYGQLMILSILAYLCTSR